MNIPIHLHTVSFSAMTAELRNCNRDHLALKRKVAFCRKILLTIAIGCSSNPNNATVSSPLDMMAEVSTAPRWCPQALTAADPTLLQVGGHRVWFCSLSPCQPPVWPREALCNNSLVTEWLTYRQRTISGLPTGQKTTPVYPLRWSLPCPHSSPFSPGCHNFLAEGCRWERCRDGPPLLRV